jgi:hypothetical protein
MTSSLLSGTSSRNLLSLKHGLSVRQTCGTSSVNSTALTSHERTEISSMLLADQRTSTSRG